MVRYKQRIACVLWDGQLSDTFTIRNGVKQGAVLSPILYCLYIDDLFKILRKRKTGCWIGGSFVGILGYADDLTPLSPTIDGLQEMVKTCEEYATEHNLSFSTHLEANRCKTKCLAFLKKDRQLKKNTLCKNDLPWVNSARHLGCKIGSRIRGMADDLMEKRAIYINKVNELPQEFHYAHPLTLAKTNNIFNTSFDGLQLWDLFSNEAIRLEKSWNVSQRMILRIPRNTQRFFIEPLSETRHIHLALIKRFVNFTTKVMESKKEILRKKMVIVKEDCRSTTGKNLRTSLLRVGKSNVNELSHHDIKELVYHNIPWKVNFAKDLIESQSFTKDNNKAEIRHFMLT